ncbi:MAG: sugar phosphate nucleotidyltransferase [Bacteroidetes bacterium]|nr:sugar phosphate nucleotidyltransferase [Bacteroidota bacterium]
MKAIIPVAGIGSRLRPHTHTQPKALIPVAGKPILAHIIDELKAIGVKEYVFVIGYLGDKIEQYITNHYPKLNSQFVLQTLGKGVGHAIWLCSDKIDRNEELLIVLGDTIFDVDLKKVVNDKGTLLGIKKVSDPRAFGVAEIDTKGNIKRLVEKPSIPKSNLALVGLYKIAETGILLDALSYNIENNIRTKDEFHLTDALQRMLTLGVKMKTFNVANWYDCGKKDVLIETNSILLKRLPQKTKYNFENTIIVPPVQIDEGCKISNSIIGPRSQIENAVLHQSVIGNDASYRGSIHNLNLGDSAEINFDNN